MKNQIKAFVGFLLVSSLFVSCETDTPENYLKIGDTTYELTAGSLQNLGLDQGYYSNWSWDGYNIDLTLVTKDILIEESAEDGITFQGTGKAIYFQMFSERATALDNGTYVYDEFVANTTTPTGTFDYGAYCDTWSSDIEENDFYEVQEGNVKVDKSGSIYEITINCEDEDGKVVKGHYKGELAYFDYTTTADASVEARSAHKSLVTKKHSLKK